MELATAAMLEMQGELPRGFSLGLHLHVSTSRLARSNSVSVTDESRSDVAALGESASDFQRLSWCNAVPGVLVQHPFPLHAVVALRTLHLLTTYSEP